MAFGWSKKNVSPIAVDFGADSLKLLQVTPSDPPQILAAAATELPESTRHDLTARSTFLLDALKDLLSRQRFHDRRAICSIPAFHTLVQNLQINGADHESDLQEQVALQLRERLNLDPARMIIRTLLVPSPNHGSAQKREVICLAAPRDVVMRYLEIARRARLDVVGMHSEAAAIMKSFEHLYRRQGDSERTTCFLDIGAAATKVIIAHGSQIVFAKSIATAGDHLTRQLAHSRACSFAEARAARIKPAGMGESGSVSAVGNPADRACGHRGTGVNPTLSVLPDPHAAGVERSTQALNVEGAPDAEDGDGLDCLIDELQLCVRYHRGLFPERSIEKLVFLGGESRNVGLCQDIARSLRIGAQLGDPLARATRATQARPPCGVDLRQPQPGWAVPLGLCLSEANL